jgi:hypothetical protein
VAEEIEKHHAEPEALRGYVDAHVSSAAQDLLGIRIFDRTAGEWRRRCAVLPPLAVAAGVPAGARERSTSASCPVHGSASRWGRRLRAGRALQPRLRAQRRDRNLS